MIISRTPFRVSLFGGGTDYPQWYEKNFGLTISASINKYCYISARPLPPYFSFKYHIRYHKHELVKSISKIEHPSVKGCFKYLKIKNGIEIVHNADIPARSGIGSSSTFTVGLLNALTTMNNSALTKKELSAKAIFIEQKIIKENVGSQDQIAASFGGINKIEFNKKKNFLVNPYLLDSKYEKKLNDNLMLIFTGISRTASKIAESQLKKMSFNEDKYKKILSIAKEADEIIRKNKNPDLLGELLDEQWKIKQQLSKNISNSSIDMICRKAKANGALGCKLLGAGGGGFVLIYARKKNQKKILNSLSNFLHVPFSFDYTGSQIVYFSKNKHYY